jgi:capsular polysaccharide biosynthesis protein
MIYLFRKRSLLILWFLIFGVIISYGWTRFMMVPKYSSQSELLITLPNNNGMVNNVDVTSNLQLVDTYKSVLEGDKFISEVQKELKQKYNYSLSVGALRSMIEVVNQKNSLVFNLLITDISAARAEIIANISASTFQESVKDLLQVEKITIISKAKKNLTPVSPNIKMNVLIGLMLGAVVGIGISFLLEILDKTVNWNYMQHEISLEYPLLGAIPDMEK